MTCWLPDLDTVLRLHSKMIHHSGGSDGVRDIGLVHSAIARASAAYGGVEAYPTLVEKAAAMGCGLAQNHGFIDGNKRIGIAVMLLILRRNAVQPAYKQQELVTLGLSVAQGTADVPDVLNWILSHQIT